MLCAALFVGRAEAAPTLMRYPSSSATAVAFVAHGDLWLAGRDGGDARRLVRARGHVLAARFSPDGRWVAYTERGGRAGCLGRVRRWR